ncbi:membrane protein [Mangrovimonas yunxiaonensis]|uniref:Membrane protein insertase YidC n=1 Tax=Mangrovimonas yunxiaonensis TaxID=1197477 RepID=A0A084TJ25_9FLAO|nr:membrane protein insertase YidC [Mangrovimonas yunxiaonensis]KFB00711.1 membrane protein [Mangrovimonas yunxiaonensis]GGH46199.1 membrane protein insertase YidC [Mangrovimonas yunxiaonensis]
MEEKKLDINSIIGFVLIFGILVYMMYTSQPTPEELEAQEKAKQEQVEAEAQTAAKQQDKVVSSEDFTAPSPTDSLKLEALKGKLGALAYSSTLPSAKDTHTVVENQVLALKFSNKGGYLSEIKLKEFVNFKAEPIYLVKDGNTDFNINFGTTDNRTLNTRDLFFEPTITKNGENTVVSMKLKAGPQQYLEYRYELKPDDYMIDFTIRSQGMGNVINGSQAIDLNWDLQTYRQAKSISYENRYTEMVYEYDGGKDSYLGQSELSDDTESSVTYVAYKQHFFSSVLLADEPFSTASLVSRNLVKDETIDTVYTKAFASKLPLELKGGELNKTMDWYFGPSDYEVLSSYNRNLDEIMPLGWGIFGWINRYVFIPMFSFLSGFLPYGIAIIVMTILVRLVMSPVTYKSYVSQAKMKILKPEITEINEKHKDNPMKKQQEIMALYSKAGASPMAGCLPALMQLPVFYALFMFFPSAFDLRQKPFLWAEDLASYDTIVNLPFNIPFYGDHVSLFPILASVAIFIYMKMTTGQQMASQPTQEGMPDMGKMMKYMIYISPLMMLFFFNNYASGLSLYYFISNLITIGIMLVIKNYIIDEDKIHAKIQQNKKKPKKQNRFQKKMQEMMEQAEEQKKAQQRKK